MARATQLVLALGLFAVVTAAGMPSVEQRPAAPAPAAVSGVLPSQLSDEAFWRLIDERSEPAGTFAVDNFISNEVGFQALPALEKAIPQGGVFIGVGPEQNFTYIVALRPSIAFIVDIRRQNMLQVLIYKAVFELSETRADFLARLFSRKRPDGLNNRSSVSELFAAYSAIERDEAALASNLQGVKEFLVKKRNLALTDDDQTVIDRVYSAFAYYGTRITYNTPYPPNSRVPGGMPDYEKIMTGADPSGRNFLASEENYRFVRDLQTRNLVIPLVGDFGGPKTIRAIGQFARDNSATVTAFYTSNVEQYLFAADSASARGRGANGGAKSFYDSVATLPLNSSSTFIRSNGLNQGSPQGAAGIYNNMLLSPMLETLSRLKEGRITTYAEVLANSK